MSMKPKQYKKVPGVLISRRSKKKGRLRAINVEDLNSDAEGRVRSWNQLFSNRRLSGPDTPGIQELYSKIYKASTFERIDLVRSGLPAFVVQNISDSMEIPRDVLYAKIGVARATITRKISLEKRLSPDESERVIGLAQLIGQAKSIVEESGTSRDFDAARWIGSWIEQPNEALGGRTPADYMDTSEGRALVSELLARQQSGAYA